MSGRQRNMTVSAHTQRQTGVGDQTGMNQQKEQAETGDVSSGEVRWVWHF
ncbi:MAG: hypothetical protein JXQ27_08860 [Acidobacteria bacterium]|nr:hypothetical protein [Acidobacteriota bacterium]